MTIMYYKYSTLFKGIIMVSTIYGELDELLLEKRSGSEEDDDKVLQWLEYWKDGELVHRSIDVKLKRGLDVGLDAANFV